MNVIDLILKKKAGKSLSAEEIQAFIDAYMRGEAAEYQVSALLMAICFQHLDDGETFALTRAMLDSGESIDLSSIPGVKVDKHSTGGVGDKTTLIVAPAAAALGIPIAKMSGRGLGHTGGTIDKLESIPGLSTELSREAFLEQVRRIGLAIAGQTGDLVPADKKLYALRDVTGTVEELSLIASSIMSKKLAAGADKIVLDVKCGSGAFMKNETDARRLGEMMIRIGKDAGRDTRAIISNMNQPLGNCVGNRLEVWEAVEVLRGRGPADLRELCRIALAEMAEVAGLCAEKEGEKLAEQTFSNGRGLAKLVEMVTAQGGDPAWIEASGRLLTAEAQCCFTAGRDGYLTAMNCEEIGRAAGELGAGRMTLEDVIDPTAGLIFEKKIGDRLVKGESICKLQAEDASRFSSALKRLASAVEISEEKKAAGPIVLARLG